MRATISVDAHHLAEFAGHPNQPFVAGQVPQAIVNYLELVGGLKKITGR